MTNPAMTTSPQTQSLVNLGTYTTPLVHILIFSAASSVTVVTVASSTSGESITYTGTLATHPSRVHAGLPPESELRTPNCSHGDRAAPLAVDPDGRRKLPLARFAPDVKNIAALGFAFKVNQVDRAGGIDRGLRLNPAVGCAKQRDFTRVRPRRQGQPDPDEQRNRQCAGCGFWNRRLHGCEMCEDYRKFVVFGKKMLSEFSP